MRRPAPVFSYSSQRSRAEENTERLVHEPPKIKRNKLVLLPSVLAGLVIIGSSIYATTLTASPRVMAVETNTRKMLRPESYYQERLESVLSRSVFNYSKLTINTLKIAEEIEQEFPELSNVSVSLPLLGRKPVIQVQPSPAAFILVGANGSFVISDEGRVMMRTTDAALSGAGLSTVTDNSGIDVNLGKTVLPRNHIDFISQVLHQLKSKGYTIESITLPPISNEMHLSLQGRPYYVKFNLQGSALEQSGVLLAMIENLESSGDHPVEYIDVRVQDRAYIK